MSAFLEPQTTGLIVIDVQERLFAAIDPGVKQRIELAVQGAQLLDLPIVVSEQYPQGLGHTVLDLPEGQDVGEERCFSCYIDANLRARIDALPGRIWLLVGLEAHVCVLQTAKDLLAAGKSVAILADAVASRHPLDCELALDELRHNGARVTSVETAFFELLRTADHEQFKALHALIAEE